MIEREVAVSIRPKNVISRDVSLDDSWTCSVEGCGGSTDARHPSMCNRHRYLLERYGSTEDPLGPIDCGACGYQFAPIRVGVKYCSDTCRRDAFREQRREASTGRSSRG